MCLGCPWGEKKTEGGPWLGTLLNLRGGGDGPRGSRGKNLERPSKDAVLKGIGIAEGRPCSEKNRGVVSKKNSKVMVEEPSDLGAAWRRQTRGDN